MVMFICLHLLLCNRSRSTSLAAYRSKTVSEGECFPSFKDYNGER